MHNENDINEKKKRTAEKCKQILQESREKAKRRKLCEAERVKKYYISEQQGNNR